MLGIEPRVEVVADGFLPMPFLVAGHAAGRAAAEAPGRVCWPPAGVRVLPCPFEVVPLAEAFWWHPIYRNDPAHAWLRGVLAEAAAALTAISRGL